MPENSAELRDRALSQQEAGNLEAAITDYEKLLAERPDDAECLGLLALALHQSGRHDEASDKWLASLAVPGDAAVHLSNLNNLIAARTKARLAIDTGMFRHITVSGWPARRIPTSREKRVIISAADGLISIGQSAEALRLIDDVSPYAGNDPAFARHLAEQLMKAGQPEKAHRLLADVSETQTGTSAEMLLARAATAHAIGLKDEARRLTRAAVTALPVHITKAESGQQFLIGVISQAPRAIARIMSPKHFHFCLNLPAHLAWKYNHLYRFWSVFPGAPGAAAALEKLPRPHLILNNWVNAELLSKGGRLDFIAAFVDRLDLPVLNHPRAVALVTREHNAKRLGDIAGLVVPRLSRFRNESAECDGLARSIAENFGFPVIIRDARMQAGKQTEKIDSFEQLTAHLAQTPAKDLYAIEFIDNRIADGLYRKIRAVTFGNEMIISHVQFGAQWNVHRDRDSAAASRLAVPPAEEAFAQSVLFRPDETLGEQAMAALRAIRARTPLDFYGIDFDVMPDGRLVFFEANAAMNIAMSGRFSKDLEPIRARMRAAFHDLIERTASRAPASREHLD
jgi:Flp pilus assembly protein TadD/glutathione synthase/RimK-type ligase-like ATP-grasp enzyme